MGAFPDQEDLLKKALQDAIRQCDMVVLSGGTSKGAGDFSHRVVSKLGTVLVHGVALKPSKPLCLAIAQNKPVVDIDNTATAGFMTNTIELKREIALGCAHQIAPASRSPARRIAQARALIVITIRSSTAPRPTASGRSPF